MRRFNTPRARAGRLPASTAVRHRLDELADAVARDLERGALASAWARTRSLEQQADPAAVVAPAEPVPPAPVIGRRFAAAHRTLLFDPSAGDHARAGIPAHPAA